MDPVWIAIAFALGYLFKQFKLPPLLGFLAAGFVLNLMGVKGGEMLAESAQLGVLLLLFSIGLKLNIKNLLKPVIWAGTTIHMAITMVLLGGALFLLSFLGISQLLVLDLFQTGLIAFTLSFSSTVFVVKILEETGTSGTLYGKIAIGILVMQDVIAVVFLTVSSGKVPSPWALALLPLAAVPWLLKKFPFTDLVSKSGHGELLVLLGVLLPIAGAALFESVGLKPDLGALIFGVLLARHPKAGELSKAMLSFKDLFLVGFFLTIGLSGIPTWETILIALLLIVLLPLKSIVYFLMLTRFKLRARTATMASFSLGNYSEFGLIVGAAGLANGWITNEWIIIFALALSFSFLIASPINLKANQLYSKWAERLQRFETPTRLPEEAPVEIGNAQVLILGMGRVGTATYDILQKSMNKELVGIEYNQKTVDKHRTADRNVVLGDVTDPDFWTRIQADPQTDNYLVVLATSNHTIHLQVLNELKKVEVNLQIASLYRYDDEKEELLEAGADIVFNLYAEAGSGYGRHIAQQFA